MELMKPPKDPITLFELPQITSKKYFQDICAPKSKGCFGKKQKSLKNRSKKRKK